MSEDWTIEYLGDGPDSNSNQHAAVKISRVGVGVHNVALPFAPGNGLDPTRAIFNAISLVRIPAITMATKNSILKKFEELLNSNSALGRRAIIADQPGWLSDGRTMMLPNGEIIGQAEEPVAIILQGVSRPIRWTSLGALKTWLDNAKRLGRKNPSVIFATASAFAGPLLQLLELEGVIFCYVGKTSQGKTSTLDFAASVVGGDPRHKQGFRSSWKATENGVEVIAREGADGLVVLDDTLLASGRGKARTEAFINMVSDFVSGGEKRRYTNPTGSASHRIIGWSSSNKSLRKMFSDAGMEYGEMYEVRYLEIPAAWRYGMFDHLPKGLAPAGLSRALSASSRSAYGKPYRRYLKRLVRWRRDKPDKLKAYLDARLADALEAMKISGHEEAEGRKARYFALVYQAGCLASKFGALPWRRKELLAAVVDCWSKHLLHVGQDTTESVVSNPVAALRAFVAANLNQFRDADGKAAPPTKDQAPRIPGYIRRGSDGDLQEILFLEDGLRKAVGSKLASLIAALKLKGLLITDDEKTCPKRQLAKGWRKRVYCVSPKLIDG